MQDAAALHPDLRCADRGNYFAACAAARRRLKSLLRAALDIPHDIYIVSNTTHAVVTSMAGLALEGFALDLRASAYDPYARIAPWPASGGLRPLPLITHVHPTTGAVAAVPPDVPIAVVDAAQSFATVSRHRSTLAAPIFFAPLHKHCGIVPGLGLLAIDPAAPVPALRDMVRIAEAGAQALPLLDEAEARIVRTEGRIVNVLVLPIEAPAAAALSSAGIEVLTPPDAALPFAAFRGLDPASAARHVEPLGLTVKYFAQHGITRISGAIRGHLGAAPVDRGRALQAEVLRMREGC